MNEHQSSNLPELRDAIIAEASSWLSTPFHHEAQVKGCGVDCGNLLIGVFKGAGLDVPDRVPHYPPDFMLHREREWFLEIVMQFADEIFPASLDGGHTSRPDAFGGMSPQLMPGDVVIFKHGRSYSHGAIIIEWPRIIHANWAAKKVTYGDASLDHRPRRLFRHKALCEIQSSIIPSFHPSGPPPEGSP